MDKQALRKLIKAVEAGDRITWGLGGCDARKAFPVLWKTAMDAYCGSLDAAKALHEALLPGWEFGVTINADEPTPAAYVAKWGATEGSIGDGFEAQAVTPARAWLLAILKAKLGELMGGM